MRHLCGEAAQDADGEVAERESVVEIILRGGEGMATVPITVIENLRDLMREKQASRDALAKKSGLCISAIHRAMNGETIRVSTAKLIFQTLSERQFQFNQRPKQYKRRQHAQA